MDGWVNDWIDGWMDGWMDGRMDGWTDGRMDNLPMYCIDIHSGRRVSRSGTAALFKPAASANIGSFALKKV